MKHLAILLIIIMTASFLMCGCDESIDDTSDDNSGVEAPEEPKPILIHLDNRAEWDMVYCIAVYEDGRDHQKQLMSIDDYGINYAELPGDCDAVVFSNGEGTETSLLPLPDDTERTYDNSAGCWKRYEEAIANSLVLGDNTVRVTSAHKEKGKEYILFHAENDGIYTFTSDSEFEIKIVMTEWNEGNWENGSPDWNMFFGTENTAELKAGYYYICLDNSHRAVYTGLHKVQVEYAKPTPETYPLINSIFNDEDITVVFIENGGHIMKIIDSQENTYVYYYTAAKTDGGYMLQLELAQGSREYIVNGYSLSALCGGENIFVSDGYLHFYNYKIPSAGEK